MVLLRAGSLKIKLLRMFLLGLIQGNLGIIVLTFLVLSQLFKILLNLFTMPAISKYYVYSSRLNFYSDFRSTKLVKLIQISDFVSVEYYTDGFFNIKFHGICIHKTFKGFGSSFVISDKLSLSQRFFIFSPYVKRVTIFSRRFRKTYI